MAQILSLKAEPAAASERNDTRQPLRDNDRQGFADAFERELKPSASKTDRRNQNSSDEADTARPASDNAARDRDGKKLPDDGNKAEKAAASEKPDDKAVADQAKAADTEPEQKTADEAENHSDQQKMLLAAFERIPANPAGDAVKPAPAAGENGKPAIDQTLSQQIAKLTAHLDKLNPGQSKQSLNEVLAQAETKSTSPAANIRADILAAIKGRAGEADGAKGSEIKIDKLLAKAADNGDLSQKQLTEMLRQLQLQSNTQSNSADRTAPGSLMNSSALAANAASQSSAALSNPGMQSLDIQADIKNPNWSRVVSSRVVWMAQQGMQQAELRLNPPTLGPVDVRLSVQNDQTTVNFIANNATTREALEQALPRLRESFQENGLQLAHADVGEQSGSDEEAAGDSQFADGEATHVQVAVADDDNLDEVNGSNSENADGLSLYA